MVIDPCYAIMFLDVQLLGEKRVWTFEQSDTKATLHELEEERETARKHAMVRSIVSLCREWEWDF